MQTSLQVFHNNYYLYIFAPDNDCRLRWVRALKEGELFDPIVFINGGSARNYFATVILIHELNISNYIFIYYA